jgi:hypothetical protein
MTFWVRSCCRIVAHTLSVASELMGLTLAFQFSRQRIDGFDAGVSVTRQHLG